MNEICEGVINMLYKKIVFIVWPFFKHKTIYQLLNINYSCRRIFSHCYIRCPPWSTLNVGIRLFDRIYEPVNLILVSVKFISDQPSTTSHYTASSHHNTNITARYTYYCIIVTSSGTCVTTHSSETNCAERRTAVRHSIWTLHRRSRIIAVFACLKLNVAPYQLSSQYFYVAPYQHSILICQIVFWPPSFSHMGEDWGGPK